MGKKITNKAEMRTIVLLDAVNFTEELKTFGKSAISPKINRLKEFVTYLWSISADLLKSFGLAKKKAELRQYFDSAKSSRKKSSRTGIARESKQT